MEKLNDLQERKSGAHPFDQAVSYTFVVHKKQDPLMGQGMPPPAHGACQPSQLWRSPPRVAKSLQRVSV